METRVHITETAYNHITSAIGLFESHAYAHASFLAITAIEEMGKARTLQMIQGDIYPDREPKRVDPKKIHSFLREHSTKALRAAASGLAVNHGALRRHGRHDEAGLNLSSGILFLGKSNKWMMIRNSCIYTYTNLPGKSVDWPTDEISAHHGYYFICMALEVLAEESDAGLGTPLESIEQVNQVTEFETASEFRSRMLRLMDGFINTYAHEFDHTKLQFFTKDTRYDGLRDEIRQQEVSYNSSHRDELRKYVMEEMSDEVDIEKLPGDVVLSEYRQPIVEEMVDTMMDTPYFTDENLHPELEDLSKHVAKYVEY